MQIDGHVNEDGFIIRLYDKPVTVWVYWPEGGKTTFILPTLEEGRALYEALKPIKQDAEGYPRIYINTSKEQHNEQR